MYQEILGNIHRLSRNSVELMLLSLKLIFIHSMATSQKSSHSLVSNVKVCEKGLVTLHVRFKKATTHTLHERIYNSHYGNGVPAKFTS